MAAHAGEGATALREETPDGQPVVLPQGVTCCSVQQVTPDKKLVVKETDMPVPQTVRIGGRWRITSFTDGFTPSPIYHQSLVLEARRNPEAVLMRLMNNGRWDLAEELWEQYIDPVST